MLLVTVELGVPPVGGRQRRYLQHMDALGQSSEVGVLVLDRQGTSGRRPNGISWWRHAAAPWPADLVQWLHRPDGHPAYGHAPPEALAVLDASVREFDPDVIVVGGLWFHGCLDRLRAEGRHVVLDAADVEAPLHQELAGAARGGERMVRTALARHVGEIERRAVGSVDQVWVCSERDGTAIRDRYPDSAPTAVVPNTVDTEALRRPPGARPDAPALVYPATFGYLPNENAAMTLIGDIHPLVRRRFATATLTLVGMGPTAAMRAAVVEASGVTITGPVADTRPWLWGSTVLAAPLYAGSGTRVKLLEAFGAGLPVVTTVKGAEGLDVVDGEHALVVESPRQFADTIAALCEDPAAGAALAARARQLVETRYSVASARQAVEAALSRVPAPAP